jgi:hypothetical protein
MYLFCSLNNRANYSALEEDDKNEISEEGKEKEEYKTPWSPAWPPPPCFLVGVEMRPLAGAARPMPTQPARREQAAGGEDASQSAAIFLHQITESRPVVKLPPKVEDETGASDSPQSSPNPRPIVRLPPKIEDETGAG